MDPQRLKVPARGHATRSLQCNEGDWIEWEWKLAEHDISFSVTFAAGGGEAIPLSSGRVDSKQHQYGSYLCPGPGRLELRWDNGHSLLRGKEVLLLQLLHVDSAHASDTLPLGTRVLTTLGPGVLEGRRDTDEGVIWTVSLPYGTGYLNSSSLRLDGKERCQSVNDRATVGVSMFFNNKIAEAECFFEAEMRRYPIFALGYATLGFVKAFMTWDRGDQEEAHKRLTWSRDLAASKLPAGDGMLRGLGRAITGSRPPALAPAALGHTLILAESTILMAVLKLTEESYTAFIRAGLHIRTAWKLYERCYTQLGEGALLEGKEAHETSSFDKSFVGGVCFGVGAFNLLISILPSMVLRLVSFMGFPSDRAKGLKLLYESVKIGGVRGPLASLVLLNNEAVIPSFFSLPYSLEEHIAQARRIMSKCLAEYPEGALFWWQMGRLERLSCRLEESVAAFRRAAFAQKEWVQLQHLCSYDLVWSHLQRLRFAEALPLLERLERENSWSRGFYIYLQAAIKLEEGREEEARALCSRVRGAVTRAYGGKIIAIEQFALRRAADIERGNPPICPVLEIMFHFFCIKQMEASKLEKCLEMIAAARGRARNHADLAITGLLRGAVLRALSERPPPPHSTLPAFPPSPSPSAVAAADAVAVAVVSADCKSASSAVSWCDARYGDAESCLLEVAQPDPVKAQAQAQLGEEKWTVPFARFELAALYLGRVQPPPQPLRTPLEREEKRALLNRGRQMLSSARLSGNFDFKMRLAFRVHLANKEISALAVSLGMAVRPASDDDEEAEEGGIPPGARYDDELVATPSASASGNAHAGGTGSDATD